jgi:hypothetical protein
MQQEGREPCQAISYYQMLTDLIGTVRYPMNLVQKKGVGEIQTVVDKRAPWAVQKQKLLHHLHNLHNKENCQILINM